MVVPKIERCFDVLTCITGKSFFPPSSPPNYHHAPSSNAPTSHPNRENEYTGCQQGYWHPGLVDLDRPHRSCDEVAQTCQEADEARKIKEAHVAMAVQKAANIEDNLCYEDQQREAKCIAEANSNRSKNTTANAEHGLSLTICGDIYISFAIDNDVQNCPRRRKRPRAMKTKKNNPRRNQPHTLMKASQKVNTCPLGSSANSLGRKPSHLH
jgi:hypothetical protein